MAMVNMKMSSEESKEYTAVDSVSEPDAPRYPYGLCIDLDDGSMEKLGIKDLPAVGTEMTIMAKVVVKSVSSNQYEGGDAESRMSLQITDMEVGGASKASNAATMLYGDAS